MLARRDDVMLHRARLIVGIVGSWLALALSLLLSLPAFVGERTCISTTTAVLGMTGLDCRQEIPLEGYTVEVQEDGSTIRGDYKESRCWYHTVSVCTALEHPLRALR